MPIPNAAQVEKIKVSIEEVNTSVNPPVAHVREVSTGGAMVVNLITGPSGTWVTPNVGEVWWIQFLGTRWTLLSREDATRGGGDTPGTSDYVKLLFQVAEQETELIYQGVVNFNSAAVNNNISDISHYVISWVACDKDGNVSSTVKANQYIWYPNKTSDGADIAVDPNPSDNFDYVAILPGKIENPKITFYKARIRAVSKLGVLGDWTDWTSPALPIREAYNLPPTVEEVDLSFKVFEIDGGLGYNAIVGFKDVGYWDLPGGDFSDDIDRYEIQLQPFELSTATYGTLNSEVNATAASLSVTSAAEAGLPTDPSTSFYITVDNEIMLVTSRSGTTWNVLRNQEFTAASAHKKSSAIKKYVSEDAVTIGDLSPAPKDELGTLDAPKSVADVEEDNWPLFATLDLSESLLGPEVTSFDINIVAGDYLNLINSDNISSGIYIIIDTETMKIQSINNNTITVQRGQDSTIKDSHANGANIYLQSWLPILTLENTVTAEDTSIKVAMLSDWDTGGDFLIKLDEEILRVYNKSYVGLNDLNQTVYELDVYRGLQNTAAQSHSLVTGYYSIGSYYTYIFNSIPSPNKYWWRARVRAVDRFNRRGLWSEWTDAIKASAYAGALPPAPTEVALDFNRNHRAREWTLTCDVTFNGVQYEIPEGDDVSDVAGYQARLFHSDGAYLKTNIENLEFTITERSLL